jgi:hypothetical protein
LEEQEREPAHEKEEEREVERVVAKPLPHSLDPENPCPDRSILDVS